MLVTCVENTAKKLSRKYLDVGFTADSKFDLLQGHEYRVYSISFWESISFYLLMTNEYAPDWYPSELFEITQRSISANWFASVFDANSPSGVTAIIGYDEIVNSFKTHYVPLIEREEEALKIFLERKQEMDE